MLILRETTLRLILSSIGRYDVVVLRG